MDENGWAQRDVCKWVNENGWAQRDVRKYVNTNGSTQMGENRRMNVHGWTKGWAKISEQKWKGTNGTYAEHIWININESTQTREHKYRYANEWTQKDIRKWVNTNGWTGRPAYHQADISYSGWLRHACNLQSRRFLIPLLCLTNGSYVDLSDSDQKINITFPVVFIHEIYQIL